MQFKPLTLTAHGHVYAIGRPQVMGILNVTDDSFYAPSRSRTASRICDAARALVDAGADIIDIGGCSTRPGSVPVSEGEERSRVLEALSAIRSVESAEGVLISVDTWRSTVALAAVEEGGAHIINDISGGRFDPQMGTVAARMRVPFIAMHTLGTAENPTAGGGYPRGVCAHVVESLSRTIDTLHQQGVNDVIADPGFGFSKTVAENYELLSGLDTICRLLAVPVLVGLSRKRMFTQLMGISAEEALPGTTAGNTIALLKGASFLRVHDPAAARQAVAVVEATLTNM